MSYWLDWFSTSRISAHILLVEKSTVNKMADRFEELIENAIQILLENSVTKTTEKATNFEWKRLMVGKMTKHKKKHFQCYILLKIAYKYQRNFTTLCFMLRALRARE